MSGRSCSVTGFSDAVAFIASIATAPARDTNRRLSEPPRPSNSAAWNISRYAVSAAAASLSVSSANSFARARAQGERSAVLVKETEQKIDRALGHVDERLDARAETVVAGQELRFARQIHVDGLLHAAVKEFGVRVVGPFQFLESSRRSGVRCGYRLRDAG